MVITVENKEKFDQTLEENAKVAVDFTAAWCPPCQMIGPKFQAMETDFPDIKFIKVDVDENDETAANYKISAMPTFLFFNNKEKVDELVGANEAKLKEKLTALNNL